MSAGSGFRATDVVAFDAEDVLAAAAVVRKRCPVVPKVALILGSGLGDYADRFEDAVAVDYRDLPSFPVSTVEGHRGRLVLGHSGGIPVVAQQGRFHLYEGYSAAHITLPLRVMHALGARVLVVTNAAGGVDHRLAPGDLMLIEDQVNFQFRSPLRGRGELVDRDRFVDLEEPFSRTLLGRAFAVAAEHGLSRVRSGTYWGNLGPGYETPSEVRMAQRLGADAVGMSTVSEVLVAKHCGMKILGITCISNHAAGLSAHPLSHQEVMAVTEAVKDRFRGFVDRLLPELIADG